MRDGRRRLLPERGLEGLLHGAGLFSGLAVLWIFLFLAFFSLPLWHPDSLRQVLSWDWAPFHGKFGILAMAVGSLCVAVLALSFAFPTALGICCFAHGLGPPRLARIVLAVLHFMTSIPTIVYAFTSVVLLAPMIRDLFGGKGGFSWLTTSLVLSFLTLPTCVLLIHAAWTGIEPSIRLTCASLGLTRQQEIFRVLVPLSSRHLAVAAVLGFGRAMGDTIVALLLSGNSPQVPGSLLDGVRTLTAHIALVVATDSQAPAYHSIAAAGLLLLIMTAALNLAILRLKSPPERSSA